MVLAPRPTGAKEEPLSAEAEIVADYTKTQKCFPLHHLRRTVKDLRPIQILTLRAPQQIYQNLTIVIKSSYKLIELIIITLFRLTLLRLSATGLRHCVEV